MVIINNFVHTQRQKVKSKAFVSVLAVVLSLLIMLSVVIVAVPTVSAKGESAFQDNECIYIDCRQQISSKYWDSDGAELRVFTFYNDSDEANFCHEFEENFQNDNWYTGSNVLQKGIKADRFADHIYRFRIPSDKLSHVRIARTDSGANNKWNLSPYMWDKQRSKTAGSKHNCIKITGWDNAASWTTFTPTNIASYNSKTAQPDASITGNSSLYTIDATFYDYYNDDEIQKNWQNINYESNHASVHYTKNNNWYWWAGYWEPFSYLNNKIAAQAGSDVNYPLYFGNFYGKGDGYTGEGASNLKKFNNQANNSNNIGGNHKSVAGLTGGTLDSNDNLVYATNAGYNSSTLVPFFDAGFLSSNKVGSVVDSKFPMRKVVSNGITTYKFDSTGGTDNVWLNNVTGSSPTVSYGSGTSYGSKDSLYSYSDREASGYGFFPFDSNRGTSAEALNYGFGMRVDVDFNLGSEEGHLGQLKGTNGSYVDQVFSFTGDDDVWVYVDGKLILDLGGDHKKTTGSINFHTGTVTADTGVTFNSATRNTSFTLDGDPTAEHTLTMFYVERGMIESNLSFEFNFAPVANQLITEKKVNTTELNSGIKNAYALTNADKFDFTSSQLNGKTYTYAHTNASGTRTGADYTVSNSKYNLRDKDTATFNDQLTVGQTVNVTESFPSDNALTYNKTSWIVVDTNDNDSVVAQSSTSTAQSLNSSFTFKTNKTGQFDPTKLKLTFTNTPAKANAVISKNVIDSDNNDVTDTKSFPATVYLSFDKGATYNTYPLTYTVTGATATSTMSNGQVTLQEGKDITIPNLPVGTYVKIVENSDSLGEYTNKSGTVIIKVTANGASTTITNQQPAPIEINQTITATKILDGESYKGSLFRFRLDTLTEGTAAGTYVVDTSVDQDAVEVITSNNGSFSFDPITFDAAGIYRYHVYEDLSYLETLDNNSHDTTYASDIYQNTSSGPEYLVEITVTKNGTELSVSSTKYIPYTPKSGGITAQDFNVTPVNGIVFTNEVQKGSVSVVKTDQNNTKLDEIDFSLFTVSNSVFNSFDALSNEYKYDLVVTGGQNIPQSTLSAAAKAALLNGIEEKGVQSTNQQGVASFGELPIYEGEYWKSSAPVYQHYCLVETASDSSHNINSTPMVFTIPQKDANNNNSLVYDVEFSYINGKMINPYTGYISPLNIFRNVGIGLLIGSLVLGAVYLLRRKKVFAKYKSKH